MNKHLATLLLLAVALAGVGFWLSQTEEQSITESGLLFPELAQQANALERVTLTRVDGVLLDVVKQGEQWLAHGVAGSTQTFPVSPEKLGEFVTSISQAKRFEAKTAKPEYYERLGLRSVDVADSQGTLVVITAGQASWQVLVGNTASSGQGSYIRVHNEAQSWLLDKTIDVPGQAKDWLIQPIPLWDKEVLQSISRAGEGGWSIVRDSEAGGDSDFTLLDKPSGRELKYDGIVSNLVDDALELEFDQLAPYSDTFLENASLEVSLQLVKTDASQLSLNLFKLEEALWLQVVYSDEEQASTALEQNQQWLYGIASFQGSQLNKRMEDFLAEPPEPIAADLGPIDEGAAPDQ